MAFYHVSFHTLYSRPVFEDATRDDFMRRTMRDVIMSRKIVCLAWEIMPAHVHMIVCDLADLPLGTIMKHVKGDAARAFFATFPELRADLLGGHLWTKGYAAVGIVTHEQLLATLTYVRTNRQRADLPPPQALERMDT